MQLLEKFFGVIGDLTWGWALIPFLVVLGLFFTLATGFVQFRYFIRMFRVFLGKNQSADPNSISAREALLVSVGGRVGGGNIAGVAVAITLGGPGAVFWMWAIAAGRHGDQPDRVLAGPAIQAPRARTAPFAAGRPPRSFARPGRGNITGWPSSMRSA